MKQFNRKELLLRIVASSADAIIFYVGYIFVNQPISNSRINILFFVAVSLCGLLVNLLPYNSSDKHKQSMMYSIIGLVLAIVVTGISAINNFNILSLPIGFAALILIYFRSNTNYISNILYIFSIGDFKRNIGLLFIINIFSAYLAKTYFGVSDELMRYTVLYVIAGLYMLTQIKNFRYVSKSENNKKSSFDIIATVSIIVLTVIMSISKVFAVVTKPFVAIFELVYGLITKLVILISYPFSMALNAIYDMIHLPGESKLNELMSNGSLSKMNKKNSGLIENYDPTTALIVQMIIKALAFLVLMAICAYLVYVLFKFINRFNRSKSIEDFEEDKEFVHGSKKPKRPGFIKRLSDTVKKTAGDIAFILTADNADKLRNEYKDFIKKLHNKKLIEHYNYTPLEIFDIAMQKVPNQKSVLESITNMYEEVRYGVKYPQDNELKAFRRGVAEIEKVIPKSE